MSWPTVTPARWLRVLASGLLARAPEDDDELCLVVDLCEAGGHHDLVERAAHAVLQLGEQVRLGRQVAAALDGVLPVVERDAEAFRWAHRSAQVHFIDQRPVGHVDRHGHRLQQMMVLEVGEHHRVAVQLATGGVLDVDRVAVDDDGGPALVVGQSHVCSLQVMVVELMVRQDPVAGNQRWIWPVPAAFS